MIKPIVRIEHTETPPHLSDCGFLERPVYIQASSKVVWLTVFGRVYAYRYGESGTGLHLIPNQMMIDSGFDPAYVFGNIVDLHNILQRAHDEYIQRWIDSE